MLRSTNRCRTIAMRCSNGSSQTASYVAKTLKLNTLELVSQYK
jgi:hypothetical protein